jgi:HAE1 family hydrophobic/amphiphilic exporter-1
MNRLARFSVSYPTTVLMIILAILLLGYISFQRLGIDLFPNLANPRLFVEVVAGDRPPLEMERQFVTRLEAAAARGRGVENVTSIAQTGRALIAVEYGWQVDMDEAFLDLQKGMADFSQRLEADEITVSQHDPNAIPIVVAAFSHPEVEDLDALRQTAESIIRNQLIRLPGIAAVELIGARRREVEVLTDAYALEAHGLTIEQLAAAIQGANRNMSGGSIVEMGRRYIIKGVGEFSSPEELDELIVVNRAPASNQPSPGDPRADASTRAATASRTPIYLRDVATVRHVLSQPENIVRLDGRRCIGLEIFKEARFNTIDASASAHQELAVLRRALPSYQIEVIQDQARFIEAAVSEVEKTGLVGIFLAVLVLYVFLRRVGVTAVISVAIPISIVATFNLMYFADLSLNLMTLGGLALGAGMLIDNAIVVVENTYHHLEQGRSLSEAAVLGAGEVGGAITSSTLTTIVVFLPIVYLHGAAGELFREQAWTVAFSLLSSLFVALVVIPMLCSRLLGRGSRPLPNRVVRFPRYAALLEALLKRRLVVLLGAAGLVAAAAALLPSLGSEFMPRLDQSGLTLQLTLPEGTSLERTEGAVRNVEAFIEENFSDHIHHLYSRVGPAGGSTAAAADVLASENSAVINLLFESASRLSQATVIEALSRELAGIPGLTTQFLLQQTALETSLGRTAAPLVVEIRGRELDVLAGLATQVQERLAGLEELTNVETSLKEGRPEINVEINRTVAAQFSLNIDAIGTQLEDLLSGRDAGQLQHRGEASDIVIRRERLSVQELGSALLEAPEGRRVRLDQVARLVPDVSLREITRNNQMRVASVSAHLDSELPFDQIAARVDRELAAIPLPPEYGFAITGEEKLRQEAFGNLRFALLLAVVLVYMVMAAQFESLVHPFVILLTIPMAGVGAVLLLLLLAMPLNVMSFIGVIMLAGIAVNDSIILVDRINQNRRSGQALAAAILNAAQTRIRPIAMTSLTTMLALLPLALGIGEGSALRAPMAVAVIGGLVTSTALTLIVIPCVYHLFARLDRLDRLDDPGRLGDPGLTPDAE